MKELCVVKFKDGRYAIRKTDCDLGFRYLDLYDTTWWRYDGSEAFKNRRTTDSKKEIFKKYDKIVNNLTEEESVELIESLLWHSECEPLT